MHLFIKSFIVGIGKIIPGVSGALIAINFNIYERAIDAVTNFFNNWKTNLKFLSMLLLGIISAIILGSKAIIYLLASYKFVTMMFFIGLISGGTYNFSKHISYNKQNIIIITIVITILLSLMLLNINNNYELKDNYLDNIIFFIGGVIEVLSSIIPGISGTSMLMIIGIYHHILNITSELFNINYVIKHINLYLSYGFGMFLSFIISTKLINYLFKKYKNITYTIILGLSLASVIFLTIITFKIKFTIIELIIGIMLLTIGILTSIILDK